MKYKKWFNGYVDCYKHNDLPMRKYGKDMIKNVISN